MTSGVMPVPVSVTQMHDVLARLQLRVLRRRRPRRGRRWRVSIVSLPPSGMASRALIARLSSAISSWLGSASIAPQAAGQHGLDRDRLAERAPQQVGHAGDQLLTSIGLGSSGWRRENASSRCVSAAARCAPRIASAIALSARGSAGGRGVPLQRLEVADDDGQQVVEVVRDAAGQLADRLHLLRLGELLRASSRASLRCRRSVMSRVTLAKPISLPLRVADRRR